MSTFGGALRPGEVREPPLIEGFSIGTLVAEGGMGLVYEAWQDHPRRRVAIKFPRVDHITAEQVARLGHEAELLGRLEHPAIARVYAAGSVDRDGLRQPYLVMEWIDGKAITRHAREAGLSVAERLHLFLLIVEGIHYAHQQGIIHRDLKPANILVDARGQPRILDFGLACMTAVREEDEIAPPVECGTLPYMAPEQLGGCRERLDVRSDIYALGVVLFELLTGALPYPVADAGHDEIRRMIREEAPSRLRAHDRHVSPDLESVVAKALEKDRALRYGSALALGEDVRRYLEHRPVSARPHTLPYVVAKFTRRNRLLVGVSSALLIAITAGFVSSSIGWNRARVAEKRAQANLRRALDTIDQFTTFVVEGQLASMPGAAPVQERLLQDAVFLYEALLRDHADDAHVKEELAWALAYLARLKTQGGDAASARAALQRQVEQWETLVTTDPARASAHRRALARTLVLLGRAFDREGDREAAGRVYGRARAEYRSLRESDPDDREVREQLAYLLGNWAQALVDPARQRPLYEEAAAEWRALREDYPANRDIERAARWAEERLAEFGREGGVVASAGSPSSDVVFDATDREGIIAAVGKHAVVRGRIQLVAMYRGRDRFTYVNFGRDTGAFFGIIHRNAIERFVEAFGEELEALPGRDVEMSGVIAIHRNRPELVLNQPSQIKLLDSGPSGDAVEAIPEISSRDLDALRAQAGRMVTITGRVYGAGTISTHAATYIDFENVNGKDKATGVIPQQSLSAVIQALGGHPSTTLKGRHVKITGRVYLYKNNPNIEITDPSRLMVLP